VALSAFQPLGHVAGFYRTDEFLAGRVALFIIEGTSTQTPASRTCVNSTRISCPIPENVSPSINQGC